MPKYQISRIQPKTLSSASKYFRSVTIDSYRKFSLYDEISFATRLHEIKDALELYGLRLCVYNLSPDRCFFFVSDSKDDEDGKENVYMHGSLRDIEVWILGKTHVFTDEIFVEEEKEVHDETILKICPFCGEQPKIEPPLDISGKSGEFSIECCTSTSMQISDVLEDLGVRFDKKHEVTEDGEYPLASKKLCIQALTKKWNTRYGSSII